MTVKSCWHTGTYELLLQQDPEGRPGDLMLAIFARPVDTADRAADEDAPILAELDVRAEDVDAGAEFPRGLRLVGEQGLGPEGFEAEYGPRLAEQMLLALFHAAEQDFAGVDADGIPWRTPSTDAFALMVRASAVLLDLRRRLNWG
jgi:hypothetical protein